MSAKSGPSIVNNSLVLNLDINDPKSYKGEPTVNYVNTPLDWVNWSITSNVIRTNKFLNKEGYSGKILQINANSAPSAVYAYQVIPVIGIATVTFSFWARKLSGSGNILVLDPDGYRSGGVRQSPDVTPSSYNFTINNEWKKYSLTINTNDSLGQSIYMYFYHSGYRDINYEVALPQLELKDHATQFVNGTRGSTKATGGGWVDLSGNDNNIDLTNARFNSNAKPIFLNDISTAEWSFSNTILYGTTNNFTIAIGYKILGGNTGGYTSLIHHINGGGNRQRILLNSSNALYYEYTIGGTTYGKFSNTSSISFGSSVIFVLRKSSVSGISFFKNGLPYGGDSAVTQNIDTNNTNVTYLHRSTTYQGYGEPLFYRIYTRDLTDDEILKNFNSFKSRFGL